MADILLQWQVIFSESFELAVRILKNFQKLRSWGCHNAKPGYGDPTVTSKVTVQIHEQHKIFPTFLREDLPVSLSYKKLMDEKYSIYNGKQNNPT